MPDYEFKESIVGDKELANIRCKNQIFEGMEFHNTRFEQCVLKNLDFTSVKYKNVVFEECQFENVIFTQKQKKDFGLEKIL